jgi:hypothetical protein
MGVVRGWGRMDLSARKLAACAIPSGPTSSMPGVASYGPPKPCRARFRARPVSLCTSRHGVGR